MAVTGSGTQTDPYIFHDFDELKSIVDARTSADGIDRYYTKLANDLDGNTFPREYRLPHIDLQTEYGRNIDIDLDGHVIKNFVTNFNNPLIKGGTTGSSYYTIYGCIHDGDFLNIHIHKSYNSTYSSVYYVFIRNMHVQRCRFSITTDDYYTSGNGGSDHALFVNCSMLQCSVFARLCINFHLRVLRTAELRDTEYLSTLCDIKVDFKNTSSPNIINGDLSYSRITGIIHSDDDYSATYERPVTPICYSGGLSHCVVDVDLSKQKYHIPSSDYMIHAISYAEDTVINTDSFSEHIDAGYGTECTAQEIRNGDALRNKGFMVVNVGDD